MKVPKTLQAASVFFSTIFSPLLAPTIGVAIALWLTYMQFTPLKARLTVLLMTLAFTCMVPIIGIFILHRLGVVKDPRLHDRRDRLVPYIISVLTYIGVAFYFTRIHAPQWLALFMLGSAAAALATLVINNWWKISGHATGMGGLTALSFFICANGYAIHPSEWLFLTAVVISGCVMTARLVMRRHDIPQVAAGFADGALWITLSQLLIK